MRRARSFVSRSQCRRVFLCCRGGRLVPALAMPPLLLLDQVTGTAGVCPRRLTIPSETLYILITGLFEERFRNSFGLRVVFVKVQKQLKVVRQFISNTQMVYCGHGTVAEMLSTVPLTTDCCGFGRQSDFSEAESPR